MVRMIKVHRKGFEKDVERGSGVTLKYIKPTNYLTKDVGAPGRTPPEKQYFDLVGGKLLGWMADLPEIERHNILTKVVAKDGFATTSRRLVALANISKKTSPETSRIAMQDQKWLHSKYRG
ncbi:MAG: hypothetical protein AABY22_33305 [Nanoarchaeota archaeon]